MSTGTVLSNDKLKALMPDAMVARPLPTYTSPLDLNDLTQNGIYFLNGQSVTNAPNGENTIRGILKVFNAHSTQTTKYLVQELTYPEGNTVRRTMWYTNWYPWRKVADTVIGGGKMLHFIRNRAERRAVA